MSPDDAFVQRAAQSDEIAQRLEHLEKTVETVCRPVAELFPADRLHEIERIAYEGQLKIRELELHLKQTAATASEAHGISTRMLNSHIWQTLIKASAFLARLTGQVK